MRKFVSIFFSTVLLLFVFTANISSQPQFEGKVAIKFSGEDHTGNMNYLIKGEKIRIDFDSEKSDEQMSMIIDVPNKKTLMIMPSQKMYMEYPYKELSTQTKEKMDKSMGEMKMTGETKIINGYSCEKIIFKQEDEEGIAEVWVTKDLGKFNFFGDNMGKTNSPQWVPKFMREGYFPMLGIQKDDSGKEEFRWEVTKIEKQSLSNDLFSPPAGFQKMEMPMMNMEDLMK